jgi:hypothetical protein
MKKNEENLEVYERIFHQIFRLSINIIYFCNSIIGLFTDIC